jgi:hypothetical protein
MKPVVFLSLIALCFALASRDPALFADGENYAEYMDLVLAGADVNAEPSFQWIVAMVDALGLSLGGVFFVYLAFGFFLKCLYFFLKMPGHFYLSLIYFTSYFVIHDLVQIRVGAALGLALWAVHHLGERNIRIASLLWLASFFLHFSVAILAALSFFIYAVDNGKIRGLSVARLGYMLLLVNGVLFVWVFLLGSPFSEILRNLSDQYAILPGRYVDNYLEPGDFVGPSKIAYAFTLGLVALYALHRGILLTFVARHAALCLVVAPVVLVAFRDMPVIGARVADMLLFFSPLMVFGLYATRREWGRVVFLAMLTVQVVNLAFFSTVILL